MGSYYMTMSGAHTLAKLQQAIRGEEALASQFVKSQLSAVDGSITNLVTFQEVNAIPPALKLLPHGSAAPAGSTLAWSGVMLVGGSNAVVDAYRTSGG
ncbi:MAG: hypothetical protein Q8K29_07760 [Polaromonas sp.]|nr:hypothetical protein [Polaromonas sp.]MDP2033291.1 hypothetical protein [Polaromonas sp.]